VPPSPVTSTYIAELGKNSRTFPRDPCGTSKHYYEAIRINVSLDGYFTLCSESIFDTFAYLYEEIFDPFDLESNLVVSDNDGCGNQQFRLCLFLQANISYILVVTTHAAGVAGSFSVSVVGGAEISFTTMDRIGEFDTSRVTRSIYSSTLTTRVTERYSRDETSIIDLLLPTVTTDDSNKWNLLISE
jgi:hypothetical protein